MNAVDRRLQRLSPLAEGRELKFSALRLSTRMSLSPLAEGRELKFEETGYIVPRNRRPSRRGVN